MEKMGLSLLIFHDLEIIRGLSRVSLHMYRGSSSAAEAVH